MKEQNGLAEVRPGVWKIRVYVGVVDGKARQRSATFHASGIRAARKQAATEAARIEAEQKAIKSSQTVAHLVDRWETYRAAKDSPSTIYRRRSILNEIRDQLGDVRLLALSGEHLDRFYDHLRGDERSESTVHHYHRVMSAILRQGDRWGVLGDVNPLRRITPPKRRRTRAVEPPEATTVRDMMCDAAPALRVCIRLAAATGLRRGELMGLRYSDLTGNRLAVVRTVVDIPGEPLIIRHLKHDKPRRISLDAGTLAVVDAWRSMLNGALARVGAPPLAPDAYLVPDLYGNDQLGHTPTRPGWLSLAWSRLCDRWEVNYRLHDLRHFNATVLDDAGIPMSVISGRLGHDRISTTSDVYTHARASRDGDAALAIGQALDGIAALEELPRAVSAWRYGT